MYIILFSICLSFGAIAKDIDIEIDNLKYQIKYDKKEVFYNGSLVELSLKKAACNEHILDRFNSLMDKVLSEKMSTKKIDNGIIIKVDKLIFYEEKNTNRAKFFKDFDRIFKRVKTEEFVSCNNFK